MFSDHSLYRLGQRYQFANKRDMFRTVRELEKKIKNIDFVICRYETHTDEYEIEVDHNFERYRFMAAFKDRITVITSLPKKIRPKRPAPLIKMKRKY